MMRPLPPPHLTDPLRLPEMFAPAPELEAWARASFIDEGAPLFNEEHAHLRLARLGFLWTNAKNVRGNRKAIAGTAEVFNPKGGAWQKARQVQQLREWFRTDSLDFLITIDAVYASQAPDLAFCSLVEHELYHCGQALDEFGSPKFSSVTGRPIFGLRPHDAEEFAGIVRRYGVHASAAGVAELVEAAKRPPEIGEAKASLACGTCLRMVA